MELNDDFDFSSSDDDAMMLMLLLAKRKRKRKHWVHPLNTMQPEHGAFVVMKDLKNDPVKFQSYYRMQPETFHKLTAIVGPFLQKKDTNYRMSVSMEERLQITLRYLATGESFRSMSFQFLRGESTIGEIVHETCEIIWDTLWPKYMPFPSKQKWMEAESLFREKWQMPNCIGSLDGKHIRIRKPPKSGSAYHNYLGYFSMVLLAVSDANSKFISICVGDYGRNSDGGVLQNSPLGEMLRLKKLNIPPPRPLPAESDNFPFYFVADEAFPLTESIMKPYPVRGLTNDRRVFNGRLSRARKSVECAFGRLASKFRFLHSRVGCEPDKTENLVKAACVLHNFIFDEQKGIMMDIENCETQFGDSLNQHNRRPNASSLCNRDKLMHFFLKPENAVPWQHKFKV